jgi:hypothetical protein
MEFLNETSTILLFFFLEHCDVGSSSFKGFFILTFKILKVCQKKGQSQKKLIYKRVMLGSGYESTYERCLWQREVDRPLGEQWRGMGPAQGQERTRLDVGRGLCASTTVQDHLPLPVQGQSCHHQLSQRVEPGINLFACPFTDIRSHETKNSPFCQTNGVWFSM